MAKRIKTVWEVWSYDVWGNEEDGYDVNDKYCDNREYEISASVKIANPGTGREFEYIEVSDRAIKEALSIKSGVKISTDGDDVNIYVETDNGYPLGELRCVSHESLSSPRKSNEID